MNKKKIYLIITSILLLIVSNKVGIYDSSIKVDNVFIKKPFLYKNITGESSIKLNDYGSTTILFASSFVQGGALYSFFKDINKENFIAKSKYKLNLKKFDISNCYVSKETITTKSKPDYTYINVEVYNYPYQVSFNEINRERQEKMIQQICKDKKIIFLKDNKYIGLKEEKYTI